MKRTDAYIIAEKNLIAAKAKLPLLGDVPERREQYAIVDESEARMRSEAPILEVGDGMSILGYSDVYPYEVIEVSKSGKKVKMRAMKSTLSPDWKPEVIVGGFAGHTVNNHSQKWIIDSDEDGSILEISHRTIKCNPHHNNGVSKLSKWMPVGEKARVGQMVVGEGARRFHDYNF